MPGWKTAEKYFTGFQPAPGERFPDRSGSSEALASAQPAGHSQRKLSALTVA